MHADPRLGHAPDHEPLTLADMVMWWRLTAPTVLRLTSVVTDGLDGDAIASLAYTAIGHGEPWSLKEGRRILDVLEGDVRRRMGMWTIQLFDGRPVLRHVPGGRRSNLTEVTAELLALGREASDRDLVELIDRYRAEGATWPEIGARLGYSDGHLRKVRAA